MFLPGSAGKRVIQSLICAALVMVLSCCAYAARYHYPYPTAENKKGLALGADMEEDALELNVRHATINLPISWIIAPKNQQNSGQSISFRYKGKTYWFWKAAVHSCDSFLRKLKQNNVIVTGILLLQKRSDLKELIYPAARKKKAEYYAWNMDGGKNQRQIEAAVSFLAQRYSSGKHGKIVGWIVGNEIDSASEWNAAGNVSFTEYMDLYARMFEMCSRIIRGVYSNARLYIPLDHFWNIIFSNNYKGRRCLDTFAARMKRDGYPWNLAYHAYNGDLMQPSITDRQYFKTTDDLDTEIITMKNLSVLTDYIREKYGEDTRVILSEHGYSSTWKKKKVSTDQSEAIALSYYLAMADPMVDSFVYYSQVDQNELKRAGATFGLWNVSRSENATSKKPSWSVFKYMDTDRSSPVLNRARKKAEQLTGIKPDATRRYCEGMAERCGKYRLRNALSKNWEKTGAVSSFRRKGRSFFLKHDGSRNKNVFWGMQKKLPGLDVSSAPRFFLTVRGTQKAELLIRAFCGSGNMFEASAFIRPGKTLRLRTDLSRWSGRSRITKIELLVKRKGGSWKNGTGVTLEKIGFG